MLTFKKMVTSKNIFLPCNNTGGKILLLLCCVRVLKKNLNLYCIQIKIRCLKNLTYTHTYIQTASFVGRKVYFITPEVQLHTKVSLHSTFYVNNFFNFFLNSKD